MTYRPLPAGAVFKLTKIEILSKIILSYFYGERYGAKTRGCNRTWSGNSAWK